MPGLSFVCLIPEYTTTNPLLILAGRITCLKKKLLYIIIHTGFILNRNNFQTLKHKTFSQDLQNSAIVHVFKDAEFLFMCTVHHIKNPRQIAYLYDMRYYFKAISLSTFIIH